ncbi:hypothetical protein QJS04_geneDACA021130 [Acorus gramineus]|uniref:Uncharacterized protein n=1 Tax=Acorus gramineus TaxID=55184 RepID=A0AAV9BR00_ACOGR|nr:hypothetical protein QJS04_geneDACA021130 [Acorus gramineus]
MASSSSRVSVRLVLAVLLLLLGAFYVGRPLYWKISATVHEIRQKRQSVREGISNIMLEARKSVGWVLDESDSGFVDDLVVDNKSGTVSNRRALRYLDVRARRR